MLNRAFASWSIPALLAALSSCGGGDQSSRLTDIGGNSSNNATGGAMATPSGGMAGSSAPETSTTGGKSSSMSLAGGSASGGTSTASGVAGSGNGGTSAATASGGGASGGLVTATGGKSTGGAPASTGGKSSGGTSVTGSKATGGGASTGGTSTVSGTECGAASDPTPTALRAVAANGTVGLEWAPVAGATSYNLYWSTSPGVTPTSGESLKGVSRGVVHRGLTNGTTYYYVVTAVTPAGESAASVQASASPTGEWVLEQLGTGDFASIKTSCPVSTIPIESRIHVLLFAEGYTASALATFHSDATHATRGNDVDRWIDEVFAIEPYKLFSEAFVVWYLPRASTTDITGNDTAFDITVSGGGVDSVSGAAAPAWSAIAAHPYAPTLFDDGRSARTTVAAFMIYDPDRKRAGLSGVTTTLTNPSSTSQRINAAFAMGHAHEFTHALTGLRDEYMETSSQAPSSWTDMSNVVGSNQCSELPWQHLLFGTAINPSTDQLVGAFGDASLGYHSELLCLLNGTHENGQFFYQSSAPNSSCSQTNCTLRSEDRMCNFCREMTALRIFQRTGVVPLTASAGLPVWSGDYRARFYAAYGFRIPAKVPQSNDVYPPDNGATIFQACVP